MEKVLIRRYGRCRVFGTRATDKNFYHKGLASVNEKATVTVTRALLKLFTPGIAGTFPSILCRDRHACSLLYKSPQ